MKIRIYPRRLYAEAIPLSYSYRECIRDHLADMGQDPTAYAYFESIEQVADLLDLPRKHVRDLEAGWAVTVLVDDWTFLHAYGWDTHTLAESGLLYKKRPKPKAGRKRQSAPQTGNQLTTTTL